MDTFGLLVQFIVKVRSDGRAGPTHISLYVALLLYHNEKAMGRSFVAERKILMQWSKIRSRHTYNRRMNELAEFGFIRYEPSSDPQVGSRVTLF